MVGFRFTVKTSTSLALLCLVTFLVVLSQFHSWDESLLTELALDNHVVASVLVNFYVLERNLSLTFPEGTTLD